MIGTTEGTAATTRVGVRMVAPALHLQERCARAGLYSARGDNETMSTFEDGVTRETIGSSPPPASSQQGRRAGKGTAATGAAGVAWELIQTVLLTLLIFVGVRSVVQNFRVEGASMAPNLSTNQYLLINKASYLRIDGTPLENIIQAPRQGSLEYLFGGPERGDVVVFRPPTAPDKDFIKRVIGLPGDTVLIRTGQVFVNGKLLEEPYLRFRASYNYPASGQPLRVPDGQYFVLGDNRPNSSDSHLGWTVPADNLVGKAWVSFWPLTTFGPLPQAVYAN